MATMRTQVASIDEYIAGFPKDVQQLLTEMRGAVAKAAPAAEEAMKYGLPTFVLKGNLVHFGAFKNHIGFYPTPSGIVKFKKEFASYEQSKGAVRFPMDRSLPLSLVSKVVKFRVTENLEREMAKKKK